MSSESPPSDRASPPIRGLASVMWHAPAMRTAALAAMALAVLVAAVLALTYASVTQLMTQQQLRTIASEARILATVMDQTSAERVADVLARERVADASLTWRLLSPSGRVYDGALPTGIDAALGDRDASLPHALVHDGAASGTTGSRGLFAVVSVPSRGGGTVVLARPMQAVEDLSRWLRWGLVATVALLAIAAFGVGIVTARRAVQRIRSLRETTERIMVGDLSRRLPISAADDDVDRLADTVNVMLARIETLVSGIRHVSDNIAHDLRTPLNRLRARVETVLRDAETSEDLRDGLARTVDEADELIRTFNAMLTVARLDAGASRPASTPLDVSALVADLVELYTPLAEERGATLQARIAPGVPARANRQLLGQAVANLIENAIKYGAPKDDARAFDVITTVAVRSDGGIDISVADHGRGIDPADRERAMQRFVRLDESRTDGGTGLGLSLVSAIARAHGGGLRLEGNRPGLRSVLALPPSSDAVEDVATSDSIAERPAVHA